MLNNKKSAIGWSGIFFWLILIAGCEMGSPESLSPAGIKKVELTPNGITVFADRAITPGAYIIPSPPRLIITMDNAELEKDTQTKGQGIGELIQSWELEQKVLKKEVQNEPGVEEVENKVVQLNANLTRVNVTYQLTTTESGFNLVLEEVKRVVEEEKPSGVVIPKELYPEIKKMEISPEGAPTGKVVVAVSPAEETEAREMLKDIIPEKAKVEKLPPKATSLENITYRSLEKSFEVIISGDGAFLDYKLDSLTNPVRIVVDIFGVKNKLTKKVFQVNDGRVRQIRVGDHPGKTRVVIELSGKIKDARIVSIENKIIIKILF